LGQTLFGGAFDHRGVERRRLPEYQFLDNGNGLFDGKLRAPSLRKLLGLP
jgi:hypothetical protein